MLNIVDTASVTIEVRGIELVALKKLALVGHMLAEKLGTYTAREEQKALAQTLDDVIRKIELALARMGVE
jgi:hypothetical protein